MILHPQLTIIRLIQVQISNSIIKNQSFMKKIIIVLGILVASMSACEQNRKQDQVQNEALAALKQELEQANKQLPMSIAYFTMQRMEIVGNDYAVYMNVDEKQIDLDEYVNDMNKNKSSVLTLVSGNHENFSDLLVKTGLNLKFVVSGNLSKRQKEVFLSSEDIKDNVGTNHDAKDIMKEMVEEMNEDLPDDWGDGLSLTSVYIDGNYVVYNIQTDETLLTIALLKQIVSEGNDMEESILEEFNSATDPSEKMLIKYMKENNMGIKYVYCSKKTNDSVTITITPEMISSQVKVTNLY